MTFLRCTTHCEIYQVTRTMKHEGGVRSAQTKKPWRNSSIESNFPTLKSFQTKVFDLALPTSTNNYNQIPFPVDCPVNGTGVITIFLIPKTEHCKRDILKPKESRTKNIFISVQESCNFESGLELKFIIHIPCNSFSST